MSKLFPEGCMKPMIILPPNTMSDADIAELRANNICVVVSSDPSMVRFVDPIPAASCRTQIEHAAIGLSKKVMVPGFWNTSGSWDGETVRLTLVDKFVELLIKGSPLDPRPSQQEIEKQAYDESKIAEQRVMAREDARAEREAKKKAALMPKRDEKGHFLKPVEAAK